MSLCKWKFNYDIKKPMSPLELEQYQHELIKLREMYKERVTTMSNCSFYESGLKLPPPDNIFGTFLYNCKRHRPKCKGWYLLWNPNVSLNDEKLNSVMNNKCATWEYKAVSKRIQFHLAKKFPDHFEYVDGRKKIFLLKIISRNFKRVMCNKGLCFPLKVFSQFLETLIICPYCSVRGLRITLSGPNMARKFLI